MPAKAPSSSIECLSLSHLIEELSYIQDALSVAESEESWDSIATALNRFGALCNGNASTYPIDFVSVLRASSRPISSALNSERTRLSGAATDLLTAAATALGSPFEPLVPHYLPTLLTLCTRTNKVFLNRAKACIAAFVEYTQAPAIIHYSSLSISDKSVSLRLAAAETMLLCLKGFNPPDLEKEARAKEVEATIRATAVDASADVRKVGRKIFDAYKILLPRRVQSFTDPLTPRTRKYLDIKATTVAPRSQPPSRPTSSQSVRSNHSDTRPIPASSSQPSTSTAAQRPTKHARSMSTSQASSHNAPPRPFRAPTPEVAAAPSNTREGARGPGREEPRRLRVDMPPPDFIPTRSADIGPQRPMSATELRFPAHHTASERPMSGPQRVIRPDVVQPGGSSATSAVRTGPIRPTVFSLNGEDGPTAEKKERVVGGARRVLRMPEAAEPAPRTGAEDKGNAAATSVAPSSKPIRPRVISTSKSTPAVPLQAAAVREEATKKLASSAGASSGSRALTTTVTKPSRTASTLTQPTAGSRARIAEKRQADKDKAKTRVSSKPSAALRAGPGTSITMRDRAARAMSESQLGPAKAMKKFSQSQKAPSKSRPSYEVEVPQVAPTEVPLPESPKLAAVSSREYSPSPLISLDTPEKPTPLPAILGLTATSTPTAVDPVHDPADIPLPSSTSTPSEPTVVISELEPEPHTPTPQQRPPRRAAEVEQTPISALVASIQRGFLSMHAHDSTPLSPMREEDESVLVIEELDNDEKVFAADGPGFLPVPVPVAPLFSGGNALHA